MLPLDIAHPLPRAEAAPECVLAHCSPARRGLFVFLAKPSRAVDPLAGRGTGRVDAASCKRVGRPRGFSHETESLPRSSVRLRRDHDERLLRLDLQHTALLGAVQLSRRGEAEPVADARRRDWWNGTWWTRSGRAATCGRCATGNGGCTRPKPPRKSSIVTTRTVGGVETFSVNQLRTWEQVFTDVTGSADDSEERNRAVAACSSRRGSMARSSKKTLCCEVVEQRAAVGSPCAARDIHLKLRHCVYR
jgi:hypothetical protein